MGGDNDHYPPDGGDDSDVAFVLTHTQTQQIEDFRDELHRSERNGNSEGYHRCRQQMDHLLSQQTVLNVVSAVYEQIMSVECAKYKEVKSSHEKKKKKSDNNEDENQQRCFLLLAKIPDSTSKSIQALRTVRTCWGQDVIQHYQWVNKGLKYCNALRAAALKVDWKNAVNGLNQIMIQRFQNIKRNSVSVSVNPISQNDLLDLKNLADNPQALSSELTVKDIPEGFGIDRFGLLVRGEFIPTAHIQLSDRQAQPDARSIVTARDKFGTTTATFEALAKQNWRPKIQWKMLVARSPRQRSQIRGTQRKTAEANWQSSGRRIWVAAAFSAGHLRLAFLIPN